MSDRYGTWKSLGLFAAGAATTLGAARLCGPVAQKIGMFRAAAGGDAFEGLIADHKAVLALLDKAEAEPQDGKRKALFLAIKLALTKHAVAEEDVIYPLIADKLLAADAAHHLYKEHGVVKTLLAEVEEALENGDDTRYRARMKMLRESVSTHAAEEEREWFPALRKSLDQVRAAAVDGKVEREKALVG